MTVGRFSIGDGCVVEGVRGAIGFRALAKHVAGWRDYLVAHDVRVLGLLAENSPEWLTCDLGARAAGVACVPLPPFFSDGQLAHVLDTASIDTVAVSPAQRIIALDRGFKAIQTHAGLTVVQRIVKRPEAIPAGTGKITFTSGSTGTPKGVCLDDEAVMSLAAVLREALEPLRIRRHLSVMPYAMLLENVAGAYAAIMAGATVIAPPMSEIGFATDGRFEPERLLQCLQQSQPESLILLPELLKALVEMRESGARLPTSLKFVAVGGGRVGAQLVERARASGIPAFEGYGLSECASVVSLNLPGAERAGSAGRPLPHQRVRIANDGEICVAGNSMLGYLGCAVVERAIATGDLGEFDSDGFLYVRGRKKNQFITSFGRNVNPEWPEALLLQSPALRQAAVFGEALPGNVAVLVPSPGEADAAIEQAITHANQELPGYAHVSAWLRASAPFSAANGQATANGRLKRAAIESAYGGRFQDVLREATCHESQP